MARASSLDRISGRAQPPSWARMAPLERRRRGVPAAAAAKTAGQIAGKGHALWTSLK